MAAEELEVGWAEPVAEPAVAEPEAEVVMLPLEVVGKADGLAVGLAVERAREVVGAPDERIGVLEATVLSLSRTK